MSRRVRRFPGLAASKTAPSDLLVKFNAAIREARKESDASLEESSGPSSATPNCLPTNCFSLHSCSTLISRKHKPFITRDLGHRQHQQQQPEKRSSQAQIASRGQTRTRAPACRHQQPRRRPSKVRSGRRTSPIRSLPIGIARLARHWGSRRNAFRQALYVYFDTLTYCRDEKVRRTL